MSNNHRKIFIDSSILVEFEKQTKTDLLLDLMRREELDLFVNSTILSEYTYYLLAIEGGKSPRSVKEDRNIRAILSQNNPEPFLCTFQIAPLQTEITATFLEMMSKYNLLPNDALILADCNLLISSLSDLPFD